MARIELTLSADYVPRWGVWEGVREVVQNAIDAQTEFGAVMTVWPDGGTLRVRNDGSCLSESALLLGKTSKRGRADLRGQHGEGLKLGLLALVRAGRRVRVLNGADAWVPELRASEKFGGELVLTVDVQRGRTPKRVRERAMYNDFVEVEIEMLDDEWQEIRRRFLFLESKHGDEDPELRVSTNRGTLLLSEEYRGRCYVRGILVEDDPALHCGYDFKHADVDRDRRMLSSFDKRWEAGQIWQLAAAAQPKLLDRLFGLLESGAEDVRGVDGTAAYAGEEVVLGLLERFQERHGSEAVAVATLAESKEVAHLGATGVVAEPGMVKILERAGAGGEAVKQRLREEVAQRWSWTDLSADEAAVLEEVAGIVGGAVADAVAGPVDVMSLVDVVDFRSAALMGQWVRAAGEEGRGRVRLARKVLAERRQALATLVHELAHWATSGADDGAKDHVAMIEQLWSHLVEGLLA